MNYIIFQKRSKILSLDIPILELSDTGQYMCIVRNDQGKIFTSCYLQVERELYYLFGNAVVLTDINISDRIKSVVSLGAYCVLKKL